MNIKLCINCKHYRRGLGVGASRLASTCHSPHLNVVGDEIETGNDGAICWQERSVGDPTQYSFHCGPDAKFFEDKNNELAF